MSAIALLAMAAAPPPAPTYALIGVAASTTDGAAAVSSRIGTVTKFSGNPLLTQSLPWESNINNGYPSVHFDADPPDGDGSGTGAYRLWYDNHGVAALAYANSTDGLAWSKPILGIVNLGGEVGTANNLVRKGNGIGVYRDPHGAAAFVGVGALGKGTAQDGGLITSPDGLHWSNAEPLPFPDPPQRFDTANNLFWDSALARYVLTTRRHPTSAASDAERAVGVALSEVGGALTFNTSAPPPLAAAGTPEQQLYAQLTWKWHQLYLGLVMVYDATDHVNNRVHCRLAWSHSAQAGWRWVDPGGLTGRDLIPLGSDTAPGHNDFDSHLCYGAIPVRARGGAPGSPHSERSEPATATAQQQHERLYYMGSNGPHSGSKPRRNASLGLATLRADGFAALGEDAAAGSATGLVQTVLLTVTRAALTLTADIIAPGGWVRLGVRDRGANTTTFLPGLALDDCSYVASNVTDATGRSASNAFEPCGIAS